MNANVLVYSHYYSLVVSFIELFNWVLIDEQVMTLIACTINYFLFRLCLVKTVSYFISTR